MRQRLAVARAFLHDPQVLLLDEPFTALDDRAIAVLQSLLRDALAAGKTVVMSTHQLREAWNWPRTWRCWCAARWLSRASAQPRWWRIPAMSMRVTARLDGVFAAGACHRPQGRARGAAHQGSRQRVVRVRAGDPAAVQFRFRSRRAKPRARSRAACCGSSSPSPARWCSIAASRASCPTIAWMALIAAPDFGRGAVSGQSAGELRVGAGGGTGLVAGLRHLLFAESGCHSCRSCCWCWRWAPGR